MTVGKDGVERDPVRIGKCYACGYTFHIWVCLTCLGPHIDGACQICHNERRHGILEPQKSGKIARIAAPHMRQEFARITATGPAFYAKTGWKGDNNKRTRHHR